MVDVPIPPAFAALPKRQRFTLANGFLAQARGDFPEAMRCYLKVAKRDKTDPFSLYFAALCCYQQANYAPLAGRDPAQEKQRAINLMWASLKLAPAHAEAWYNLGKFYQSLQNEDKALECFVAAMEHKEDFGQACVSAGNIFWDKGDEEMAEACYRKALGTSEGGPEAVYNLSFMLHFKGQWPDAFQAAEARWDCPSYRAEYQRPFMNDLPRWNGGPLAGTLLVHGEQGAGDVLQMLRYIPELRARVPDMALEVFPSFVRLCEASFPGLRIIERGGDITGCMAHLPTVSLPWVCGTSYENPPPKAPYLFVPEPALPRTDRYRIGLCWAGSPTHPRDHTRSMPFAELIPLLQRDNVEWVNLQVGERQLDWLPTLPQHAAPVAHVEGDYYDTASLIAACDLIITVDTSVAHLAGALGIPCWMLVARFPDVRWEQARNDTLWYSTLQIFRQTITGQWGPLVAIVRQLLDLKVDFGKVGL